MNATTIKPMLAKTYESQDVKGWLMSEKLDGVRAIWDGSKLISRNGNEFFAPDSFIQHLPHGTSLDGELYIGRGLFQSTVGIVRKKKPIEAEWDKIKFCVFDAPEQMMKFDYRLAFCEAILKYNPIAEVVNHLKCESDSHLKEFFTSFCYLGAEGIMIRNPDSEYIQGRSSDLLKYKPLDTAEGVIIGLELGKGRLSNKAGNLVIKWGDIVFNLGAGMSDEVRSNPPAIGSEISFSFMGVTDNGLPRFPIFLSDRHYE